MPTARLIPFGYTGKSRAVPQGGLIQMNGDACNLDTHRQENWPSRGYNIVRQVGDSHSKMCASWVHRHTDGGQRTVYLYDTALYPETGSDSPSALKSGLTATFKPVFVNQDFPTGFSAFFNGTNSESQLIQEISNALDARNFSFAAPTNVGVTADGTPGGSFPAGTYRVAVTALDKDGDVAVESAPYYNTEVSVSLNDDVTIDISSATIDARATHYRIYMVDAGGADAPSGYFQQGSDTVIGTTSVVLTSYDSTSTTTLNHVNETGVRQAHLPLDNVECAVMHKGRLFIGSSTSNKVYWSERDNINHWRTINVADGLDGGVIGLVSAHDSVYAFTENGINRIFGTFARDATNFILNMDTATVPTTRVLTGPNAAMKIDDHPWFMSDQGLAVASPNGTKLVHPQDAQGQLDNLDFTYRDRWVVAEDPNGYVCILATRLTNSTRPPDGASIAGIADIILRYDYRQNLWACPLRMGDITHLSTRVDESAGSTGGKPKLMAGSMTGRILQMGIGFSGGVLDTSGTEYDGQASTSEGTTTVAYTEAGVSADDYNGMTVTLYYPEDDDNYPGLTVQKTIVDTAVSGSTVTLTWIGALTAPTGSATADTWTVRVAGLMRTHDLAFDAANLPEVPPGARVRIKSVRAIFHHTVGAESVG